MTKSDEEREEKEGIKEFFKYIDTDNRRKTYQAEFESLFHFIDRAINGLKLIPYSYLSEKLSKTEEEEVQANARKSLTGVMKVSMFKSFDSSIYTFRKRIEKYELFLVNFEDLFFIHKKIAKPLIIQKAMTRYQEEHDEDALSLIFDEIDKFNENEEKKKKADSSYKLQCTYADIQHDHYNVENMVVL